MTLLGYVGQRVALSVPVFFGVLTMIFFIVRVLPGDPAQVALGDYASREAVEALRSRLGLDAPLPIQYARFLHDLASGDLGVSLINGTPVREQIAAFGRAMSAGPQSEQAGHLVEARRSYSEASTLDPSSQDARARERRPQHAVCGGRAHARQGKHTHEDQRS